MARWLGIDHGTRRIGVAVGDEQPPIASPLEVIPVAPGVDVFAKIVHLAREYDAAGAVVGWPLNMDDTEGPQGQLARQFARDLAHASGLDVRLYDERLSSHAADGRLAGAYTRKQKRARQDAVAAATILQDFLTTEGPRHAPRPEQAVPPAGPADDNRR